MCQRQLGCFGSKVILREIFMKMFENVFFVTKDYLHFQKSHMIGMRLFQPERLPTKFPQKSKPCGKFFEKMHI